MSGLDVDGALRLGRARPRGGAAARDDAEADDRGDQRVRARRRLRARARLRRPVLLAAREARPARDQPRHRSRLGRHAAPGARGRRPGCAKELIFTGRLVDAEEALRIGLVQAVHDPVLEQALATARVCSRRSRRLRSARRKRSSIARSKGATRRISPRRPARSASCSRPPTPGRGSRRSSRSANRGSPAVEPAAPSYSLARHEDRRLRQGRARCCIGPADRSGRRCASIVPASRRSRTTTRIRSKRR